MGEVPSVRVSWYETPIVLHSIGMIRRGTAGPLVLHSIGMTRRGTAGHYQLLKNDNIDIQLFSIVQLYWAILGTNVYWAYMGSCQSNTENQLFPY